MSFLEELYRIGLLVHKRLSKPKKIMATVISVGNLTTGGTGKTQMVLKIAQMLKDRKVCILSRGYIAHSPHSIVHRLYKIAYSPQSIVHRLRNKGRCEDKGLIVTANSRLEDVGDEPLMLSRRINIPILVGKNRAKQAMFAIKNLGIDTIILDDGFQHWGLFCNLDILLINGGNPFGNYHLLPYGILREPLSSMDRADIIVITKTKNHNLINVIRKFNKTSPIFEAYYKPETLVDNNESMYPLPFLSGKKVLAISGIQDPQQFEKNLEDLGCKVYGLRFPDHHPYSPPDIEKIKNKAKKCDLIVSTLKDKERLKGRINSLYLVVSFLINDEESFVKEITIRV